MSVMTKLSSSKRDQTGQALPLGIALLLFGTLFAIVLFNSGQLTTEKSRIVNAADAAAYSGLVWQARALNFSAYTNRAMVANQVSIAQFVSLNSWTIYALDAAETANNTIGLIPPVRPYTQAVENYAEMANTIVGKIAEVAVPVISGVNEVLSQSQEAVYYSSFLATPEIVKEVARANDDDYQVDSDYALVSMAHSVYQWKDFSDRYGDDGDSDGMPRKVRVIENSLDDFSAARSWDLGKFYVEPVKRVEMVKEGGTRLQQKDGEYSWLAKDGLSLHWEKYRCSWRSGCRWRKSEWIVGGGSAYASEDLCSDDDQSSGDSNERRENCTYMDRNRKTEREADRNVEEIAGYEGVKAYRGLKELTEDNKDPKIHLRVKVHVSQQRVRTASAIEFLGSATSPSEAALKHGIGPGMYRLEDKSAGEELASVSSAELYFKRPDDEKRRTLHKQKEYGNLFNPYWQVRLNDTPRVQQLAAWATQDEGILDASSGLTKGLNRYASQQEQEFNRLTELRNYNVQQAAEVAVLLTEQTQITNALQGIDSQLTALHSTIADLESAGETGAALLAGKKAEAVALVAEQAALNSQFATVSAVLTAAQDAEQLVTTLDQQIASYSTDLPGLASIAELQGWSDGLGDAVEIYQAFDAGDAKTQINQLMSMAEGELQGGMEDMITEELKNQIDGAAASILEQQLLNQGISFSGQDLKTSYEVVKEEYENSQDVIDTAQEIALDMAGDILIWIDESESGGSSSGDNIETLVALAMQEAVGEAEGIIDELEIARDADIKRAKQDTSEQIANYQEKLDNYDPDIHSLAEKTRWEELLDSHKEALVDKPTKIAEDYRDRIGQIRQQISTFLDTHSAKSMLVRGDFRSDINELKQKIRQFAAD